jgi:hypothetical protein
VFAVPPYASWEESSGPARAVSRFKWALDTPIVWDVEFSPSGVVEGRLFGICGIGFQESPIGVEGGGESGGLRGTTGG